MASYRAIWDIDNETETLPYRSKGFHGIGSVTTMRFSGLCEGGMNAHTSTVTYGCQ